MRRGYTPNFVTNLASGIKNTETDRASVMIGVGEFSRKSPCLASDNYIISGSTAGVPKNKYGVRIITENGSYILE